ncbi:hypothetical protein D3C87_1858520 [compost metagenome]
MVVMNARHNKPVAYLVDLRIRTNPFLIFIQPAYCGYMIVLYRDESFSGSIFISGKNSVRYNYNIGCLCHRVQLLSLSSHIQVYDIDLARLI